MSRIYKITKLPPEPVSKEGPEIYALEPKGAASGLIEAASGYIGRLARAHSVIGSVLINHVLVPREGVSVYQGVRASHVYGANGYGIIASRILSGLTKTSPFNWDFSSMTFMALGEVLDPKAHSVVREKLRWCSKCWQSDYDLGEPPYLRLLWTSPVVEICPVHECVLDFNCPDCGKEQDVYPRLPFQHLCQHCGHTLYFRKNIKPVYRGANERQFWYAESLYRLIEQISGNGMKPSSEAIPAKLRQIANAHCGGSLSELGAQLGISYSQVSTWVSGESRPTFRSFMELCFRLRIPPSSMLFESHELTSPSEWRQLGRFSQVSKKNLTQTRLMNIRSELRKALASGEEPPLLVSELAKQLGVSTGTLNKHFPDEYQRLRKRTIQWRNHSRTKKYAERIEALHAAADELFKNGIPLTERHVRELRYLRPSDLRRPEIKDYLRKLQMDECDAIHGRSHSHRIDEN